MANLSIISLPIFFILKPFLFYMLKQGRACEVSAMINDNIAGADKKNS